MIVLGLVVIGVFYLLFLASFYVNYGKEPISPSRQRLQTAKNEEKRIFDQVINNQNYQSQHREFINRSEEEEEKQNLDRDATQARGCFLVYAEESNLHELKGAVRQIEDRFNRKYNYSYVVLSQNSLSEKLKMYVRSMTNSLVEFGEIPSEYFTLPPHLDQNTVDGKFEEMRKNKVIYGDDYGFHFRNRYFSGPFAFHPLLMKYDYYWRFEPKVEYSCDVEYDVFQWMKNENKKYGFIITIKEFASTIPTLWEKTKKFLLDKGENFVKDRKLLKFIVEDVDNEASSNLMNMTQPNQDQNYIEWISQSSYNLCHFWTNFEILDLNLVRSPEWQEIFRYYDNAGGFFYERWADPVVHTIATSVLLNLDQVHWFKDFGYHNSPYTYCPQEKAIYKYCHCNPPDSYHISVNAGKCARHFAKLAA